MQSLNVTRHFLFHIVKIASRKRAVCPSKESEVSSRFCPSGIQSLTKHQVDMPTVKKWQFDRKHQSPGAALQ